MSTQQKAPGRIDMGKAIEHDRKHRWRTHHGDVRAICKIGVVTIRTTEIVDRGIWCVEVIRNPTGVVERQFTFTSFTVSVDVFHALVEKHAVPARAAA